MDANAAVFFSSVKTFVVGFKVYRAGEERGGGLMPQRWGVEDLEFQADARHIFRLRIWTVRG